MKGTMADFSCGGKFGLAERKVLYKKDSAN